MKLTLDSITKKFPSTNKRETNELTVIDNMSLEIPDGKLVGLLGPSGCGKSTTLNIISGLIKPTKGRIFFGDDDVTATPPESRGVGLVFQNYALYPHLNVLQNIIFPLGNLKGKNKLSKNEMVEKAYSVAKLVQIENLMSRKPSELSGGQQQRVAIARALVKMPKVLLLDEPLSNLDARLRLQTREEIKRIQQKTGITTIFVTHDQEEAMSISDIIVVMKDGKIQQIDSPQEVYDNPANLFVAKFLGTPQISVFNGEISNNSIFIDENKILDFNAKDNKDVYVAIRPEGFIVNDNGALPCSLIRIEKMGRDISILSSNKQSLTPTIRSITTENINIDINAKTVKFNVNPNKIFVFDKSTGERIR